MATAPAPKPNGGTIKIYKTRDDSGNETFFEFENDAIASRASLRKSGLGAEAYEVKVMPSLTGLVKFLNTMRGSYPERMLR